MKLLIAEDDLTSRTMLAAVSRKWGYEPITVADGETAWQALQQADAPQLLLIDWMMPGLDGIGLCRRIRAQENSDPPYIILLTARSETGDIVAGLEAGANDYVAKPFQNAELRARLLVGRRMLGLQAALHQARQALVFQAEHDALTHLLNRGAIMEALHNEMARAQRQPQTLCIGLCDIDHFKRINDNHGHLAGDAVLQQAAKRIQTALRPYDVVGRYGGEEFLLLLNANAQQALDLFERIRCQMGDSPIRVQQSNLEVTISCGVALYMPSADRRDAAQLLAAADTALYAAKAAGRNRTVFARYSELAVNA